VAEEAKPWMVRDVPEETRKRVKLYAVQNDMTIGEALAYLVEKALGGDRPQMRGSLWIPHPSPTGPNAPTTIEEAQASHKQMLENMRTLIDIDLKRLEQHPWGTEDDDEKKDEDKGGES
jgi:hypothetical protein